MNEYLKRDEVFGKLDAMIAYWETRDDCWVHTLQVARSAIASIEPVKEVAKEHYENTLCECWESCDHYAICNGTKERDMCHCGGDVKKCDFYPKKIGAKNG